MDKGFCAIRVSAILCVAFLSGCSGYLAQDIDAFKASVAENHPTGSSRDFLIRDIRQKGFRLGGAASLPTPHRPEPLPECLVRNMAYGFWGGGHRYVCFKADPTGKLVEVEVFQLVAGL